MKAKPTASLEIPLKPPAPPTWRSRWRTYYEAHKIRFAAALFFGGFLLDALMLSAPDSVFSLSQQVTYLGFLTGALFLETRLQIFGQAPSRGLQRIWPYRELVLHFVFGSLLSLYSLYFLKSSSLSSSLIFMTFIFALLVVNELPQFQKFGLRARWALLSTTYFCFFITVMPLAVGKVGPLAFMLSVLTATAAVFFPLWLLSRRRRESGSVLLKNIWPVFLPLLIFPVFYGFKILPPVPMAVMKTGVYHQVEKDLANDAYLLFYERPRWKFWQRGDRYFKARPDSKIFVFAAVYSPAAIQDRVYMNWQRREQGVWRSWQRIPLDVKGGRDQGYRGFTAKANYEPGQWRVLIETSDAREIGRVRFDLEHSEAPIGLNLERY